MASSQMPRRIARTFSQTISHNFSADVTIREKYSSYRLRQRRGHSWIQTTSSALEGQTESICRCTTS